MKKLVFILFLLGLLDIPTSLGAQSRTDNLDTLMRRYNAYGQFNGSVLVAENGSVIFKKGYGWANMEWEIPNTPDTKFRLGSITKQFTSMIILQLVEQNKIKLNGTITDYMPDYPKSSGSKVTVHQLLSHTSGIPNYTALPLFRRIMRTRMSNRDVIKTFCDSALQFEPGTKFSYSNSNFIILGAMIESVTGKRYEQVLSENILTPLGMTNTGYDHSEPILKKRAQGYEKDLTVYRNADFIDMSIPFAAGSLYSTVEDLYLWDQALYTEKLLSKKHRDLLFTGYIPTVDGLEYAYGWGVGKVPVGNSKDSVAAVWHNGGINGFETLIMRIPSDRDLIVLLTNTGGTKLDEISRSLRGILYGKTYDVPKQSAAEHLMKKFMESDIESVVKQFHEMKNKQSDKFYIDENEMNAFGYLLLGQKKNKEAIEIFKLNVEAFPGSWNVYDSLGEAYLTSGDKELAIKNYEKSLQLNPQSVDGKEILDKLKSK